MVVLHRCGGIRNPILRCPAAIGAMVAKLLLLHSTGQPLEAPWKEGMWVLFSQVRGWAENTGLPQVCTGYFASTDLKAFVVGCVSQDGGLDSAVEATTRLTVLPPPHPEWHHWWWCNLPLGEVQGLESIGAGPVPLVCFTTLAPAAWASCWC